MSLEDIKKEYATIIEKHGEKAYRHGWMVKNGWPTGEIAPTLME